MRWLKKKKRIDVQKILKWARQGLLEFAQWFRRIIGELSGRFRRRAFMNKLQRGDIVLASPRTIKLSPVALTYRLLLRSRYVHSMLYIGQGQIVHTTTRGGVVVDKLPRKIFRSDRYAAFRVRGLKSNQRSKVVHEALKWRYRKLDHVGLVTNVPSRLLGLQKPIMRWERNRVWCSKLIYKAFKAVGFEIVPFEKSENITSEDLSRSPMLERV